MQKYINGKKLSRILYEIISIKMENKEEKDDEEFIGEDEEILSEEEEKELKEKLKYYGYI